MNPNTVTRWVGHLWMKRVLPGNSPSTERAARSRTALPGFLATGLLVFLLTPSTVFGGDSRPRITHIGIASPDIIELKIGERRVRYGRQEAYSRRTSDQIKEVGKERWVFRGGVRLGTLVGKEGRILFRPGLIQGEKLDLAWAHRVDSYRVKSGDDRAFSAGVEPVTIHRKSKPTNLVMINHYKWDGPVEHTLFLKLPKRLTVGRTYTVQFKGSRFPVQRFHFDPNTFRSEAVHVSHLGFRPDDPAKVAFLSCWMGNGGPLRYQAGLPCRLVDKATGRRVWTGKTRLAKSSEQKDEDAYKRNYNGTDVWEIEFSGFARPGVYRVVVDGVGCSFPFEITPDAWRNAFRVAARGFYHRRSGIPLGSPYTTFKRPRSFHPADGVKVYASTAQLMDTGNGLVEGGCNFKLLVKGKTDQIVPNAWGGYMDAGDWDRRIQHLDSSRLLIELAALFPSYFNRFSLNIPESKDGLPDIVSEALFNLDFYRRLQTPAGGIRGGIESAEHPRIGECSWQESLTVMAYAPGVWSSYLYAGVAARAALVIAPRNKIRARQYRDSALRAMAWAERELAKQATKREFPHQVRDARNLAAAELFRLTGAKAWHDLFLATTAMKTPGVQLFHWKKHEQRDAAWVYLRTAQAGKDAAVLANCRSALLAEAEERVASCAKAGFRWTKFPWRPVIWGGLNAPDAVVLCRAHALTGKSRYLRAAVLGCQTGGGANPNNVCYTTGLGARFPLNPLELDSRISGVRPPPGITVPGPVDFTQVKNNTWHIPVAPHIFPSAEKWPVIESYWDVFWNCLTSEPTIHIPMSYNTYVWGYLAARGAVAPRSR